MVSEIDYKLLSNPFQKHQLTKQSKNSHLQLLNNNLGVPTRNHRVSNAGGINIKDVFDVNGGPYGQAGQINQAYEPVIDDDDRNSLRLTPRNQVSWTNQSGRL